MGVCPPRCQAGHRGRSQEGGTPQLGQVLTIRYPTLRPGPEAAFPSCCQPALCPQARHSPASWWTGKWSASSCILLSTPSLAWSSSTGPDAACGARSAALTGSSRWRAAGATAAPATASGEAPEAPLGGGWEGVGSRDWRCGKCGFGPEWAMCPPYSSRLPWPLWLLNLLGPGIDPSATQSLLQVLGQQAHLCGGLWALRVHPRAH